MFRECPGLPERKIDLGLRRLTQIVGPCVGDDADYFERLIGAAGELKGTRRAGCGRHVPLRQCRVDNGDRGRRGSVGPAKRTPFRDRHAHDVEVVLCDRTERDRDAIGQLRRARLTRDLDLARPLVAGQRHAPCERRSRHARHRRHAFERQLVELDRLLPLHGRDRHREDVLGVVAGRQAIEVAGRADEKCRACKQSHRQHNLQRRDGAEQAALVAAGGRAGTLDTLKSIREGCAGGGRRSRHNGRDDRGEESESEDGPADLNRVRTRYGLSRHRLQSRSRYQSLSRHQALRRRSPARGSPSTPVETTATVRPRARSASRIPNAAGARASEAGRPRWRRR